MQWFNRWVHPWITRANGIYLLGWLLLLQGAKYEWYHLPPEAISTFQTSQVWLQQVPRVYVAVSMGLGIGWLLWQRPQIIPRLPYWGGLLVALLFPFLITTGAPAITFLATAYHEQNIEVVRHVEKKFPEVQSQWKQNISFDQTQPITSILTFNIEGRAFFQVSNWERVVLDGFGYRNAIFDFVGKGWGVTVAGLTLSLMGVYMQNRYHALDLFHQDMRYFLPMTTVVLGVIIVYLVGINIANHQLATEMGQGHYQTVVRRSRQLSQLYPPLRGDETFLKRWAMANFQTGTSDRALSEFTQGCDLYRAHDFFDAKLHFEAALDVDPALFLARGYLASAWVNQAVEYFKTTDRPKLPVYTIPFPKRTNFLDSPQSNERPITVRSAGAIKQFETALIIFPNNIAALYNLMLAQTVTGDFEASAQTARQHINVQRFFQKSNVALLGQAYLHQTWADYHMGDMDTAWQRYRQSRDSKAWKQTVKRSQ
ncbi:MAG: hypothetical protein AAF572_16830 [Cyanobacteria bacterium P01_B01_bin.77]